jgi:hypothetical protein
MDRSRDAGHSSPISQAKTAALDPDVVVHDRKSERLLPLQSVTRAFRIIILSNRLF